MSYIFLDELESLFQKRCDSDQNQETSRSMTNELLLATQSNPGVLLMGATNLPWQVDEAFIRRFSMRCYIPLPNAEHRYALLKKELKVSYITVILKNYEFTDLVSESLHLFILLGNKSSVA
jgi:SpoVK/Ycf46/Vps4 family AAA+-type ATPase